jgi:hypothetical protein
MDIKRILDMLLWTFTMLYYGPLLAIAEVEQRTLLSFSRRGRVGTYATTSI